MLRYLLGQVGAQVVGFAGLVVLTRLLPRETYGGFAVLTISLGFATTLGAFGWPQAAIHFLAGAPESRQRGLRSVVARGVLLTGGVAAAGLLAVALSLRGTDHPLGGAALLAPAVLLGALSDYGLGLVRNAERAGTFAVLGLARRTLAVAGPLVAAVVVGPDLGALAAGLLAGEAITAVLVGVARPRRPAAGEDGEDARTLWRYSAAVAAGLVGVALLSYGDRWIVERFRGAGAVAVYAVCSGLVAVGLGVVARPMQLQAFPRYSALWRTQGPEATRAYLESLVRLYYWVAVPVAALLALEGPNLLPLVAGREYAGGHALFGLLAAAFFVDGITWLGNAGLHVGGRTRSIAWAYPAAAAANLLANLLVVPRFGIVGAAAVTVASYFGVCAWQVRAGFRVLRFSLRPGRLAAALVFAAVAASVVRLLDGASVAAVAARVALFLGTYSVIVLGLDRASRSALRALQR